MLIINVKEQEFYDGKNEVFFYTKACTVKMEHSLMSIAKWEAFWEKPYLAIPNVTKGLFGPEEELHYIRCMIIGGVPDYIPSVLIQNHAQEIKHYINKKHTATTINRRGTSIPSRQIITAEVIYYWMIKFAVPFECQRWHFNSLLMLIDVCNIKENSSKGNKLSSIEAANYKQQLNKARRAAV